MNLLHWIGQKLARYLSAPRPLESEVATSTPEVLAASLRAGDVVLVAGNNRISTAIKYLTQSSWSHAALYVGDVLEQRTAGGEPLVLIEADVNHGVRAVPLSKHSSGHTRICRPVGLSPEDIAKLCDFVIVRLGLQYDLKNIFDLARYLIPSPFVPVRWRRRLLTLGSGDPTRAICSSLIAQAFQSVRYPILPEIDIAESNDPACIKCRREILHIRHHSLFTPRDFDVSPYFQIVKPALVKGFDHSRLHWGDE